MIRALDVALFRYLNSWAGSGGFFDTLIIFCAQYLPYILAATFLALLFFAGYTRQKKIRIFFMTATSVIIARLGITELIRAFYHRPRPFMAYSVHQLIAEHNWSFPSGHAAFFFAMAAAIYCYNKKWGVWFFLASMLIGIARVIAGVHYPSDIIGGMVIGTVVGYVVFFFAEKRSPGHVPPPPFFHGTDERSG